MAPLTFTYSDVQLAQRVFPASGPSLDMNAIDAELRSVAARIPTSVLQETRPRSPDLFDNPFTPRTLRSWDYGDFDLVKQGGELKYDIDPNVWRTHGAKKESCISAKALGWDGSRGTKCKNLLWRPTLDEFLFNGDADSDARNAKPSPKPTTSTRKVASHPKAPPSSGGTSRSSTQSHYLPSQSTPRKRKPDGQPEPKASKLIVLTNETKKSKPLISRARNATKSGGQQKRLYPCGVDGCTHVCFSAGDLRRHHDRMTHKKPSVPCPKACGMMFTRDDAAKRHLVAGNACPNRQK